MINAELTQLSIMCRSLQLQTTHFFDFINRNFNEIKDSVCDIKKWTQQDWILSLEKVKLLQNELKPYKILYPTHRYYPARFYELRSPPVFLCTKGELTFLEENKLTVVGSRRTLLSFTDWMDEHYFYFLKKNAVVTVSGGAYGIDACATRIALFSGRPSILILPSGFCRVYPEHVKSWLNDKSVLSISEYFPYESVRKHHFVNRNRLLGAISPHLFAVQCSIRSGTMTTVHAAIDCGADIFTLSSFPGAVESAGNIQLIKDGAGIVSCADDLELSMGILAPNPDREKQKK